MTIFLIGVTLALGIAVPLFYLSQLHAERKEQYERKMMKFMRGKK